MFLNIFLSLNYPLIFFLLDSYVNLNIDLFLTSLLCICRIVIRARPLGSGVELGTCSNSHPYTSPPFYCCLASSPSLALWHSRSCICVSGITISFKGFLGSVSNNSFDCILCQLALMFNNSESNETTSFDLIHYDIWRLSFVTCMSGSRFFVIFVDDFSCYT